MSGIRGTAFLLSSTLLSLGAAVTAHRASAAPLESPVDVRISQANPSQWVVRYEYIGGGLLFSDDAGASWKLLCNGAIDPKVNKETKGLAIASNGAVFTGSFDGMWRVDDGGCEGSEVAAFDGQWVTDVTHDPSDPSILYAVTATTQGDNGVLRYDGTSDTWAPLGTREPLSIHRIQVAKLTDGVRLYESIPGGELMMDPATGMERFFSDVTLRYSDDGGETWTASVSFEDSDAVVAIEAVDPQNPDRVVISETYGTSGTQKDRLWINEQAGDGGAHRLVAELEEFGGAVFGTNGELWFADEKAGVSVLQPDAAMPQVMWPEERVHCLSYSPATDTLLGCRPFAVAELLQDGTSKTVLDFSKVAQWVTCDNGKDVPALCAPRLRLIGWCGPTHFPESGVCAAYCYPGRGYASDAEAMTATDKECDPDEQVATTMEPTAPGTDSNAVDTVDAAEPASNVTDNGLVATATPPSAPDAAAGSAGTTGKGAATNASGSTDNGGCSVGRNPARGGALLAWLFAALAFIQRRRVTNPLRAPE